MRKAYLYIIKSETMARLYIGVSYDVQERLERHNSHKVISTAKHAPYQLIHTETFENLVSTRRREKFLKGGDGRRVIKSMLLSKLSVSAR